MNSQSLGFRTSYGLTVELVQNDLDCPMTEQL